MKLYEKGMKKTERAQRRVTSMVWGEEHAASEERRRELGWLSLGGSRGGGRALLAAFSCVTGGWRGGRARLFSEAHRKRTRVMVTNYRKEIPFVCF